jgi:hypothetical protein
MAGHFSLPAEYMSEREDKCKFERQQQGHFSSHISCRSALRGRCLGFRFCHDAPKNQKTGSGTHHDGITAHTHTSGAGRFEEPLPKAFLPRAGRFKTRSEKMSTVILENILIWIQNSRNHRSFPISLLQRHNNDDGFPLHQTPNLDPTLSKLKGELAFHHIGLSFKKPALIFDKLTFLVNVLGLLLHEPPLLFNHLFLDVNQFQIGACHRRVCCGSI